MPLSMSIPSLGALLFHVTNFTNNLIIGTVKEMVELAEVGNNSFLGNHLSKIVHDLLHIGQAFCDYGYENPGTFGFTNQNELMEALRQVQTRWAGQINMDWDGETVYYRAHQPQLGENVESVLFTQFVHGTQVTSQEFDEELFMAALMQAAGQKGKPLDILRLMANHGFNTIDRESPIWQDLIGQE